MFSDLLNELKDKEIQVSFSKGKLQYSGPEQNIDDELLSKLKKYKPKLLKHFWPKECPNMMPINTEGELAPFVLLHGGPANYPISEHFGSNRPFYGFFYIGSEGEKIRYKNVESFANEYLRQLQNIIPNGPIILGGMSMGGHLAYEIAIRLQKQGYEIPLLVLVDSGLLAYESRIQQRQFHKKIFFTFFNLAKSIYHQTINIYKKVKYDFFTSIFEKLPIDKRKAYIVCIYDQLIKKYKPVTEYKGEVLLFRASENNFNGEYLGWEKVCKNINIVHYVGNHGAMFDDLESVDIIKTHIAEWLNKIENKK